VTDITFAMYLHPLIASVPPADRAALIRSSELRSYRRNETVLPADTWTDRIYCVATGLLRAVDRDVTTDFIRRGDFFLGPSLSENSYQATSTLVAALPSSVYLMPITAIRGLCAIYPEVTIGLLEIAMKRITMIRGQLRRISSLSAENLVGRVLHELTQLAPAGSGGYDKRITQAVIASYSGLSREVVNKTMRDLESRGLVRRDENGIHIPPNFASTDFGSLLPDAPATEGHEAHPMFEPELFTTPEGMGDAEPKAP